ncbi:MAG: hypothetical protein IPH20_19250 [Bacteroidales bacterium]|nr:hypothetical protein [Bacteroidales bacterium]
MKKRFRILIISLAFAMIGITTGTMAQPSPGGNAGGLEPGGPPIGGGTAPIGSGITLLLLMAAGYGIKRNFDAKNKLEDLDS